MSKVDLVVLGHLSITPLHGYELIRHFEKKGIDMWIKIKTPSVYKALQRLEKSGMITGKMQESENTPPRKVYTITAEGRGYLRELIDCFLLDTKKNDLHDFWFALLFAKGNITKEHFKKFLLRRIDGMHEHRAKMQARFKKTCDNGEAPVIPFYGKEMIILRKQIIKLEEEALGKMIDQADLPENADTFVKENNE